MRTAWAAARANREYGTRGGPVQLEPGRAGLVDEMVVHRAGARWCRRAAWGDLRMDLHGQVDDADCGVTKDPVAILRDVAERADEVEPVQHVVAGHRGLIPGVPLDRG